MTCYIYYKFQKNWIFFTLKTYDKLVSSQSIMTPSAALINRG